MERGRVKDFFVLLVAFGELVLLHAGAVENLRQLPTLTTLSPQIAESPQARSVFGCGSAGPRSSPTSTPTLAGFR